MPVPVLVWGMIIAANVIYGGKKGYEAQGKYKIAKSIDRDAHRMIENGNNIVKNARFKVMLSIKNLGIQKLEILANSMEEFRATFTQIHSVDISPITELNYYIEPVSTDFLDNLQKITLQATDILQGVGQATVIGTASAYVIYGGVGLVEKASTGIAIANLSGVAAKNATLAWFGGGSLASGGAGMAGGMMVLGGLVTAPMLMIGGIFANAKAENAINSARTNIAEAKRFFSEAKRAEKEMKLIFEHINEMIKLLQKLDSLFASSVWAMQNIIEKQGCDFQSYTIEAKEMVYKVVKLAQLLCGLINVDLFTDKGKLTPESEKQCRVGNEFVQSESYLDQIKQMRKCLIALLIQMKDVSCRTNLQDNTL